MNSLWESYERCANLCADYKERFEEHVPMEILVFNDFDTISDIVEQALINNKKL